MFMTAARGSVVLTVRSCLLQLSSSSSWTPRSSELSSKLKVMDEKVHAYEEEKVKLVSQGHEGVTGGHG